MTNKPVLFCVDDEKIVLDSLKTELKTSFGDEVTIETAESALEALEAIDVLTDEGYEIALVISDYVMPVVMGDVFLSELHSKYPRIVTIMLSGQATLEGITNAINQSHLYRYISKPWDPKDFQMTVREALKSYYQVIQVEQKTHALEAEVLERKHTEELLRGALREREVLLKEVYHRTKNNMNVIISLLNLQSDDSKIPALTTAFKTIANRIFSMSVVHEKLYNEDKLDQISLADYLETLIQHLKTSLVSDPSKVSIHFDADATVLTLEQAVPLGLAVNEIITNAFIHGFKGNKAGHVYVNLEEQAGGQLFITIKNDGQPFHSEKTQTLGMRLIQLLVVDQLGGAIEIETSPMVAYHIRLSIIEPQSLLTDQEIS